MNPVICRINGAPCNECKPVCDSKKVKSHDTYTVKLNGTLRAEGLSLPQACIYAEQLMEEYGDNAAVVHLIREVTKMEEE